MKYIILLAIIHGILSLPVEDDALTEFTNGNHKFSAAVYKEVLKEHPGNFIVSPFSAEVVLALTNEGARGDTSAELMTGLSLPSTKEKTQKVLKSFLPQLRKSEEDLKLLSANKIYAANDLKLEDEFKSIASTVYDSEVDNVDFSKSKEASSEINNWVEGKTNHKIQDLIKPGDVNGDTKMVLVNALYFSGKWVSAFEKYSTRKKKFFKTKEDSVEIDTMHQTEFYNYYENPTLNAKFLELLYKGGNISMVIVLPNEIDGLARLEQNVEQLLAPQPFKTENVEVELPKFTIETEIKFVPILKKLGVEKLFGNADLSGLSSTHKGLYVSDVIQKAFINVTESGTEAAAATAVIIAEHSLIIGPSVQSYFHADHSFLYFIKYNGIVLFSGRYTNPI